MIFLENSLVVKLTIIDNKQAKKGVDDLEVGKLVLIHPNIANSSKIPKEVTNLLLILVSKTHTFD